MSLANALRNIPVGRQRRQPCSVGVLLETLNEDDSAALADALATPDLSGSGIARVLTDGGHQIAPQTIQRHRRGDCSCKRGTK